MLDSLQQWIPLTPSTILILIALVALLESLAFVGLLLPGVALLFALAAMAGSSQLALSSCLLAACVGAICGDGISFLLGRYSAEPVRQLHILKRHPQWLQRGEAFFYRWGGLSIVTGRFVGPIRPVIPFVAGSCGMSATKFGLFNLFSALAWAPLYLLPGYLTGRGLTTDTLTMPPLLWSIAILLAALVLFQQFHQRLHPQNRLHTYLSRILPTPWPPGPTLLLLSALIALISITVLTIEVGAEQLNMALFVPLHTAGEAIPRLALAMTLPGDIGLCAGLALLCALFGQVKGDQLRGWGIPLGVFGVIALNHLLKELFAIPRPEGAGLTSFSYPSGHASTATAFFTLTAVWLLHNRDHWTRHIGYLCTIPMILAVALSRPMLGVHWPFDVLAGVAEALIVAALYRLWLYQWPSPVYIPLWWAGVLGASAVLYTLLMLSMAAGHYPGS